MVLEIEMAVLVEVLLVLLVLKVTAIPEQEVLKAQVAQAVAITD